MSYGRFQPNMRGTSDATNQQLLQRADDLRAQAQVQAIIEQDFARQALADTFNQACAANIAGARTSSVEVQHRVIDFCRKLGGVLTHAEAVRAIVPIPQMQIGPYQRQNTYSASRIDAGLAAQDEGVANILAGAGAEAAAIVDLAFAAALPAQPDRAMKGGIDAAVDGLRLALMPLAGTPSAANAAAQRILRAAMDADDSLLIWTMLAARDVRTIYAISGVNQTGLTKTWAQAKLDAVKPDANGVTPFLADVPGGALLRLQSTDQALAKLPGLAKAAYQSWADRAKAILNTSTVKAAMQP